MAVPKEVESFLQELNDLVVRYSKDDIMVRPTEGFPFEVSAWNNEGKIEAFPVGISTAGCWNPAGCFQVSEEKLIP